MRQVVDGALHIAVPKKRVPALLGQAGTGEG